jgi:hypothetical protein
VLNATTRQTALPKVILLQRTMTFILLRGRIHVLQAQNATPWVGCGHHALPALVGDMMQTMIIATRLV